ncbi:MAG: serine/threonine protein kinase, partial [Oscillatoriales cyanobacterium SM2_1_8]|nr:serine/threonine protein kinase [Oscillatoriales cyanobacterium SM2_1_8]
MRYGPPPGENNNWELLKGKNIEDRYLLKELIGSGAYGGVFRADSLIQGRQVGECAIKLMRVPSDREEEHIRFQELQLAFQIDHSHIIRYFQPGRCKLENLDFFYLPMELGTESLEARLRRRTLNDDELKELCQHVAAALRYLHEPNATIRKYLKEHNLGKALVHRDIKPANILRVGDVWKVCDLGIARTVHAEASRTSNQLFTRAYASPEAFDGTVSPASDIWALGITLAVAKTNRFPFPDFQTVEQLIQYIRQYRLQLPNLPEPIAEIVRHCLNKKRTARWTASQILEYLSPPRQKHGNITPRRDFLKWVGFGVAGLGGALLWDRLRPQPTAIRPEPPPTPT